LDQAAEIADIRSTVARFFTVYDVNVSYDMVELMVTPELPNLEEKFEGLRKEMFSKGYIPILEYTAGEHKITMVRKPPQVKRRFYVNLAFLLATTLTTIYAGMILWQSYSGARELYTLDNLVWGVLTFAIPLLLILGTHELSHFFMSKRYGVDASLPYFIPAPPPIGTFGAFISMRDPMPSKKALIDIGFAGPLGGLLVAIPVAFIGLLLNTGATPNTDLVPAGQMGINLPLFFEAILSFVPLPAGVSLHPTAFAAWVGFFVTAINLLPAGQLDGGHIARGLLGKNAKYLSIATVAVLFVLGIVFYLGWLLFAALIAFLGLSHPAPLNDVSKIGKKHLVVGVLSVAIMVGSFVFTPLFLVPSVATFDLQVQESNETTVAAGGAAMFLMTINNTGTMNVTVDLNVQAVPSGWSALVYENGGSSAEATNSVTIAIPYAESAIVALRVMVPEAEPTGTKVLKLEAAAIDAGAAETTQIDRYFTIHVI
jgi:hypothetical protein